MFSRLGCLPRQHNLAFLDASLTLVLTSQPNSATPFWLLYKGRGECNVLGASHSGYGGSPVLMRNGTFILSAIATFSFEAASRLLALTMPPRYSAPASVRDMPGTLFFGERGEKTTNVKHSKHVSQTAPPPPQFIHTNFTVVS